MTNVFEQLEQLSVSKNSKLCVGLDTTRESVDRLLGPGASLFDFNKVVIEATKAFTVAYKPQFAYYAAARAERDLELTCEYIKAHTDTQLVLDTKRGDIGETAKMYALEAFERYNADVVTVNGYMGRDTIDPFTGYAGRGVFCLCRTSNPSAVDVQDFCDKEGRPLYRHVADKALNEWNQNQNVGLVVGGTYAGELKILRAAFPKAWFLVPGVGAQGANVADLLAAGKGPFGHRLLISVSRGILQARGSGEKDLGKIAAANAEAFRNEFNQQG